MEQLVEQENIESALMYRTKTPTIELLTVERLLALPPPAWLIDGVIEEEAFAVLYGPSGEGKTFVALDWALSIATNREWHGRAVSSGPVVYVVAEGGRNIGSRIAAWMEGHQIEEVDELKNVFAVLRAVQMTSPDEARELVKAIAARKLQPRLIVVDTLARCFGGGDENSAQHMGQFVQACDQIRRATGAAVLAVHHTGKGMNSTTERGSSALRGAADSMIHVEKNKSVVSVKVDKQKDSDLIKPVRLRLEQVAIRVGLQHNRATSCVLVACDADEYGFGEHLNKELLTTLKALVARPKGATSGEWRSSVLRADGSLIPARTFQNHRNFLIERELVELVDGREHWYRATELGIATATGVPFAGQQQRSETSAASATPLSRGGGGIGEALGESRRIVVLGAEDDAACIGVGSTGCDHSERPSKPIEGLERP